MTSGGNNFNYFSEIDSAWFNVCTNTIYIIRLTVFTGQKTQPTV